jgi:hypothetical protein
LGEAPAVSTSTNRNSGFFLLNAATSVLDKISGTFRASQDHADSYLGNKIVKGATRHPPALAHSDSMMKRMSQGVALTESRGSTRISEIIQHRQLGRTSLSVSSRHNSTNLGNLNASRSKGVLPPSKR